MHCLLRHNKPQVGDLDLPEGSDPYSNIPYSVVDSPKHQALARQVVAESVVVLHNGMVGSKHVLPLKRGKKYAVIGPSADDLTVQAHTYHGTPRKWITVLDGLVEVGGPSSTFTYSYGCTVLVV
jgi:beta-glucosidase-like glycosyl hydrolase